MCSSDLAAEYLGLEVDDVKAALRDGKTLATLAGEQDKSVDGLIDAMVAAATARIDEAVAEGDLDEAKAAEIKASRGLRRGGVKASPAAPAPAAAETPGPRKLNGAAKPNGAAS